MNPQTILTIIPARGGSQRLPRKNLRQINGEPLVALAVQQAKASMCQRVIVSTEDDEIEGVARTAGAEVIKRPVALAQGEPGSVLRVVRHVLDYLEKYEAYKPLIIVLVQPTSPLRTAEDIDNTIRLMLEQGTAGAETLCEGKENGAVYVMRTLAFLQQKQIPCVPCAYYQMPKERSVDIDSEEDLERAEAILSGDKERVHKGWPKGVKRGKR